MSEPSNEGVPRAADLVIDAASTTAASLEQNGIPCVRTVTVSAFERLHATTLCINIENEAAVRYERGLETIPEATSLAVDVSDFIVPLPILRRSSEREPIDLTATLVDSTGRVIATARHRLIVVPASHWCGLANAPESLASFVTPNTPALRELLLAASARLQQSTGNGALDGYLSKSAERTQLIAEACYQSLAERGIVYIVAQPSFEEQGQKVRNAAEVLADGAGNCLDLSVTLAAILEAAGLAPAIAIGDGHAVVSFATTDDQFSDAIHEGASRMANRIELGEYRAIESTGACSERCSFSQALTEGERFVREASESMRVLDVRAARRSGIHPLPDLLDAKQGASLDTRRPVKNTPWKVVQPTALPPLPKVNRTRSQERLDDWQKRLLDLTLRNRLLNDREKLGIPLMIAGDEPLAHLENLLWNEKPMKLVARGSTRLTTENVAAQARARSENEFDAAGMIAELNRSWLRSTLDEGELFNRATKAFREAKSSLEETGARSLYIAIGFLEFRVEPRDTPVQAPLLLVPMEMQRISRSEGFRLTPVAEETVPNVALVEYLRSEYGLDIDIAGAISDDEHGVDVPALLARVRKMVSDVKGARVVSAAKLGNYSFKKLPLFQEMRKNAKKLVEHPVVSTLIGRERSKSIPNKPLITADEIDAGAPFTTVRLPLAADSSQIAAICSAVSGATFVLQGPPGTGKSQTITNLLCESLAQGKRVLFIAEKSAALDVVSDRLNKAGLGCFALDLHADHATKTAFVAQVKRAFDALDARAAPGSRKFDTIAAGLDRSRARLASACSALHDSRGDAMTAHHAIERIAEISDATNASMRAQEGALATALDGVLPVQATEDSVHARLTAVATLANAIDEYPGAIACPIADFSPSTLLNADQAAQFGRAAGEASAHIAASEAAGAQLALMIGATPPRTLAGLTELVKVARTLAIDAPGAGFLVECALAADHAKRLALVKKTLDECARAEQAETELAKSYDRAVLELPLVSMVGDLRATREKFVLFRWLAARKARASLLRLAKSPPPSGHDAVLSETERVLALSVTILTAQPHKESVARYASADESAVDFAATEQTLTRARLTADTIRASFPKEAALIAIQAPKVVGQPALRAATDALSAPLDKLKPVLANIDRMLSPLPPFSAANPSASNADTATMRERLDRAATHAADFPAWSACTVARAQATALGLESIAKAMLGATLPTYNAQRVTESALLTAWTRARLRDEAPLADCGVDKMDLLRRDFLAAIAEYRKGAAAAVATLVRDRARVLFTADNDDAMRSALRTLQELRALTTIRRPIRRVMLEGAPAIIALMPIVLASPLSASTLLAPEFPAFDLVVFDEASQIPVWDAACAISRGKASVIVGDSKQLPPTNFFDRKDSPSDDSDAEGDLGNQLENLESVLDESIAAGFGSLSLNWHYRSRDERLIEFANRKSYGGTLQTFPASHRAHPNLGVEFRFVGGIYDRGNTATNRIEAVAVVAELTRRLLDDDACTANRSLGVVTFSQAQQTLVQDLLDEAVDKDGKLRERMAEAAKLGEEVFVKNLENVQGDERATMLFSICYGRDANGVMYHNFGPLNLAGGERRLNVAVTRAREKIVLFTSIRSSDLDPAKCNKAGAQHLREYLAYAELGVIPSASGSRDTPREVDVSAIESAIKDALESRGWRVDLHVGRSRDYRVSLALAHKSAHTSAHTSAPERWVLGVELDGAFYAAAPSVIDRETVRDGVLKSLDWRILKVSCVDWLRDPSKVIERIDAAARAPKV